MAKLQFAAFELDLHGYELRESGNAIKLQPQPARVLALLASHPGKLVTRDEIRTNVWGNGRFVDFEQGLNFCVRRIRSALRDDAERPRFIQTVPRRGYRFIAPVSRVSQESSPALRRQIRLAVIPLEELSSGHQRDYFAMGLAEEMIAVLSRLSIEHLRVIGSVSGTTGQQDRMDLDRLRDLNIDYVLRGSIRRSDERIRIAVQLLDLSDGGLLRSEIYERESKDLFALQEELARQVAQWLAIELLSGAPLIPRNHVPLPAAHDAYLKARFFWHKMTAESMRLSVRYFQDAITADPNFAAPYAGLADCYAQMGSIRLALMKPNEALANARPLLERALELDNGLAEAHCTLGMLKSWYELDWTGAGEEFQRALALDANSTTALMWHALHLSAVGHVKEALSAINRARELDPLSVVVNTYVGVVHFVLSQFDLAVRQLKQTIELDPYYYRSYLFLGKSLAALSRHAEAVRAYRESLQRNPESLETLTFLACELAIQGQRISALDLLDRVRATKDHFEPSLLSAAICGSLGDFDEAFRCLERALQKQAGPLYLLRIDNAFEALRGHPRYRSFLGRIGLAPVS